MKGSVVPHLPAVNKYAAIGKTFQIQDCVFAKARELFDEIIDKGTVKLAVLYLISAIAYLPVFQVIFQSWKIVYVCHVWHVITSIGKANNETPLERLQRGFKLISQSCQLFKQRFV
jgi:hypothetical protein